MIQLIGIPFDSNSSFLRGPSYAPPRIRLMEKDGSANSFTEEGTEIKENIHYTDFGDLYFQDTNPEKAFDQIRDKISILLSNELKILTLGGDHSVSYPVIDAYTDKFKHLHVLQLDAHSDLYNSYDNNPYSHASPFARLMEKNKLASLTQVGIRALTSHQQEQANKFGVKIIEMRLFNMDFIKELPSPLYISLDIDVLDPAYAPGVSHHEPGGMTSRELLSIIQNINAEIVGADIVEYNPVRDLNNMTAMVCYKIMKELLAKML